MFCGLSRVCQHINGKQRRRMQKCFLNLHKGTLPAPGCAVPCFIVQSPGSKALDKLQHLLFGRPFNFFLIHARAIIPLRFHNRIIMLSVGIFQHISELLIVGLNFLDECNILVLGRRNWVVAYPAVAGKVEKVLAWVHGLIHVPFKSCCKLKTFCCVAHTWLGVFSGRIWRWRWRCPAIVSLGWFRDIFAVFW